jgi:hypothetical protein
MAKEREGKIPLAERLEPGDVDFGKVSFVDFDGDCGGECVCGVVWCVVTMQHMEVATAAHARPRMAKEAAFVSPCYF